MSAETTITEADYGRFKKYIAELEAVGWIVKPANEGRWVPEGEACCGPAAQIIHVQSQGGKIHMGLGERCEDNIAEVAAPRAEGLDVDELRDTLTIGLTFARMSRGGSGANFLDRFNATRRDFEKKASAALARLSRPSDEPEESDDR